MISKRMLFAVVAMLLMTCMLPRSTTGSTKGDRFLTIYARISNGAAT